MLHAIAAGTWNVYQQQLPYLAHARDHGHSFVPGQVLQVDRTRRLVELAPVTFQGEEIIERREREYVRQ
jgi:NADH dehydrogenase